MTISKHVEEQKAVHVASVGGAEGPEVGSHHVGAVAGEVILFVDVLIHEKVRETNVTPLCRDLMDRWIDG